MAYILPGIKVFQEFATTPLSGDVELRSTIVGPSYNFVDYVDKGKSLSGTYSSSSQNVVQYPSRNPGDIVDTSSVKVFLDKAKAELFEGSDGTTDSLEKNKLSSSTSGFYFKDYVDKDGNSFDKSQLLHSRGVKTGDIVEVTDGSTIVEASVIGFENGEVPSSHTQPSADSLNHEFIGAEYPYKLPTLTVSGTGTGLVGLRGLYKHKTESTSYTVDCTVSGALGVAEFSVTDTGSDIISPQTIITTAGVTDYPIGSRGVVLILDDASGSLSFNAVDDVFTVNCFKPDIGDGAISASGKYISTEDVDYTITCIDKGLSGSARVAVTTPGSVDNSGPVNVISGQEFPVGTRGAKAIIEFPSEGVLIPGNKWLMKCKSGGTGDPYKVSGLGDETFVLEGSFSGQDNLVLEIESNSSGDFSSSLSFDWKFYTEVRQSTGARSVVVSSGTINTNAGVDDENTLFTLDFGLGVKLIPGTGGQFTATHVEGAKIFASGIESIEVLQYKSGPGDSPKLEVLSADPDEANFTTAPVTSFSNVGGSGSISVEGKYRNNNDSTYTITDTVTGGLGTLVLNVAVVGDDSAHTITTVAGVTRYYLGSHGLILNLSSGFVSGGALSAVVEATNAQSVVSPSASIVEGYRFSNPIKYTVVCSSSGALGTATFDVISTNGIDDASIITQTGVTDYLVGSRGVKISFDLGSATGFSLGQKWVVDTSINPKYVANNDDIFTVEILRGGDFGVAEVKVTSQLGDSLPATTLIESADPSKIGESILLPLGSSGLLFSLVDSKRSTVSPDISAEFVEGDKWTITVSAKQVKGFNKLVLSESLPSQMLGLSGLSYKIFISKNDQLIPETDSSGLSNFSVDETTVTLNSGVSLRDSEVFDIISGEPVQVDMPVADGANIHIQYEALKTKSSSSIDTVSDISEIEGKLGKVDPRNRLAYAVSKALANSNVPVEFIQISSNDSTGYQKALDLLEKNDTSYALVPLSQEPEIISLFKTHVDTLSSPDNNKWRVLLASQRLETEENVLGVKKDTLGNEIDWTATILDDPNSQDLNPPIFTKVVDPEGKFITSQVSPGDLFRTDFINGEPQNIYKVDKVISEQELILFNGPNSPVTIPKKYEIFRELTKEQQAKAYASIAENYNDHRVYLFWPDEVEDAGKTVPGYNLCAAVAGLISALPPQQGFTNLGLAGFSEAPKSRDYFTNSQLNIMAEAGVYIVAQDTISGNLYTRHQLSTDNTSLELRELSITKNFDSLSYSFKQVLEPFIGVWNITPTTIHAIENVLVGVIESKKAEEQPKIGPPLLDAVINSVSVDPVFKDKINIDIDLNLPAPLNNINLKLRV